MKDTPKNTFVLSISKVSILFYSICVLVIASVVSFIPFHRMDTNEKADNPQNCQYYITLQSVLANYQLLSGDKANLRYIKDRLLKFEADSSRIRAPASIVNNYRNSYFSVLSSFGATSIKSINNSDQIIQIARSNIATVDGYYLDRNLYCINPLYWGMSQHKRRILQYNLGGLYDQMPDRYLRAMAAFPNDSQLGVFSGFFVNNQTTGLETQFITGMPMLTALYVLPGHDYAKVGSYEALVPWGYFRPNSFTNPRIRRVLDVAGIDVVSVLGSTLREEKIKEIPGTKLMKSDINPMFGGDVQSYINTQSYGMAYLVNHVYYENPKSIKRYEKKIKRYFSRPNGRNPVVFTNATKVLYDKLMALENKHDAIIELNKSNDTAAMQDVPAGTLAIKGIVGGRALFKADCQRSECTFVANISNAPGWHAYVNGEKSRISRANFAFISTTIPSGESTIWLIYAPMSETISYFLSIISLIVVLAMGYRRRASI